MQTAVRVAIVVVVASFPAPSRGTPALYVPWPCEVGYAVTNGHGTSTHTAMDEWAWDFGIPLGAEVASPAAGVVRRVRMDSTRGGCDPAYANDANYVIVDFEDGTEALLMHLEHGSSALGVGDRVEQGETVGRVGLTGWACGAHLHFQIQQSCSSWWCQSVRAAFVDAGDPSEGDAVRSTNCPEEEPCSAGLDGGATLLEETSECFERETSWWWDLAAGHDGHYFYTWANAEPEPDTVGRWVFAVSVPGPYLVEVHVPGEADNSRAALYVIRGGHGPEQAGPVDQSAATGWVELGVFDFDEGDRRTISLADNTGEERALDRRLAFDAVRFSYSPEEPDAGPDGGDEADAGADADGADARVADPILPRDGGVDVDGWEADPSGAEGGCQCALGASGASGSAVPAAVGALVLALLRRASRRRPRRGRATSREGGAPGASLSDRSRS